MGDLGCGAACLKYILIIFNLVFFLVGAAIFGTGIWLQVDPTAADYLEILQDTNGNPAFMAAGILLICVGLLAFFVGFLGCCGAYKESPCLLLIYAIFLSVLFIVQIVAAILAAVYQNEVGDELESAMAKQVSEHVSARPQTEYVNKAWARLQYNLKCCGGAGYMDYQNSPYATETGNAVPPTCCRLKNSDFENPQPDHWDICLEEAAQAANTTKSELYAEGCYEGLLDWATSNSTLLLGLGFGLAIVQVIGIVAACYIRRQLVVAREFA